SASLILAPIKDIVPEPFRDKVREIKWGADTDIFDPALLPDKVLLRIEKGFDPEDILLLHFGSLRKWHGLVKLLEAFDMARARWQRPVKLIVLGPAKPIPRENVHFAGVVPHTDMPAWLKICDLAVFPFSPEQHRYLDLGFYWSPLKVFEAMAMELPVITLGHPRLGKILGAEDPGFYYDGTTADLAEKMVSLVERLPECESAGKQMRERLLRLYSWEVHGNQLHKWLTELVAG
ncbi:MAG TPA: glycosyltransferase, partial [Acidobacteriota bacterium]|nr:glycosyltransferase [Acidobacteriota bacterium]